MADPVDHLPLHDHRLATAEVLPQVGEGKGEAPVFGRNELDDFFLAYEHGEGPHLGEVAFHAEDHTTGSAGGRGAGCQGRSQDEGRGQVADTEVSRSSQRRSSEVHRNQITAIVAQMRNPPPSFITIPAMVWSATALSPQAMAASP